MHCVVFVVVFFEAFDPDCWMRMCQVLDLCVGGVRVPVVYYYDFIGFFMFVEVGDYVFEVYG